MRLDWVDLVWSFSYVQAWLQKHSMLNYLFNCLRLNHLNHLKLNHLNCLRLDQDWNQFQIWYENQIKKSFKYGIQISQHSENLRTELLTSAADNSVQYITAKRNLRLNMLKTFSEEDFYWFFFLIACVYLNHSVAKRMMWKFMISLQHLYTEKPQALMMLRRSHLFCEIGYFEVVDMTSWAIDLAMEYSFSFPLTFLVICKCSVSLLAGLMCISWRRNYPSKMKVCSMILSKFSKSERKWRDQTSLATLFNRGLSMLIDFYVKMHWGALLSQWETIRTRAKTDKSFGVWEQQKMIAQGAVNTPGLWRINFCMKIAIIVKSVQTEAQQLQLKNDSTLWTSEPPLQHVTLNWWWETIQVLRLWPNTWEAYQREILINLNPYQYILHLLDCWKRTPCRCFLLLRWSKLHMDL